MEEFEYVTIKSSNTSKTMPARLVSKTDTMMKVWIEASDTPLTFKWTGYCYEAKYLGMEFECDGKPFKRSTD